MTAVISGLLQSGGGAAVLRVLLADDEELVRFGLRTVLESAGIEVVGEAFDGDAGLDIPSPCYFAIDSTVAKLDGKVWLGWP
jgi:DNA-binding response OmpR family regulator